MMIASAMSPQVTPARSCRSVGCSRSNLTTALSSSELLSFTPPAVYRGVAGQRLVPSWAPGPGQTGGGGSSAAPTGRLGSIPVKKRPTTVIRATSHSAVRRPISLAEAFSATIASWVEAGSVVVASCFFRSESEMKGMPLSIVTVAWAVTSAGTDGLWVTPVMNDVVRLPMRTAPTRAVPREAPKLVKVFWRPPTSALMLSGRAETVTAPSCDASAPMPRPTSAMGIRTMPACAPGSRPPTSTRVPANIASIPRRTTRRGEARGANFGTASAARSRVSDSGRRRRPVCRALSSSTTDKKSGMVKKIPDWIRNWKKKVTSPPVICRLLNMERRTMGLRPASSRRASHNSRAPMTSSPPMTSQTTGEGGPVRLGPYPSPDAGAKDPVHGQREPDDGEQGSERVEGGARLGRGVLDAPDRDQDDQHDHDFACEHPAPRGEGGDGAADQWPGSHCDGTRRRDQSVGGRPTLLREIAGHKCDDGRHDQRGPEALQARPSDDQHGQVGGEGRDQRPGSVDHQADGEGPTPPDECADLPTGDHEGGHHQGVEGDRRLNAGHGGAEVVGHRPDGDVHDRGVERHEELPGRKDHQHTRAPRGCVDGAGL